MKILGCTVRAVHGPGKLLLHLDTPLKLLNDLSICSSRGPNLLARFQWTAKESECTITQTLQMRPTIALLQHSARLTLFTRTNCSLCSSAKALLANLEQRRSFEYHEVNVMAEGQQEWKDMYEFDVPVVGCGSYI